MSEETSNAEWVLPAFIPFDDLKGKDLEECVYWLLDAMGAKNLEWRVGGTGGGAADGGRDLEAHFFTPDADGELRSQKWWIECKGRAGTVPPDEVKSAVNNAVGDEGLDFIVIATNTQFSNQTRDWVREWQRKHRAPIVRLWDHAHLERYLSSHPEVVLRLFSQALSPQGRYQAMESHFWNRLEFQRPQALADLWDAREDIEFSSMGSFAAIANEFASGDITHRPWGAKLESDSVVAILVIGLINVPYLMIRSSKAGIDQRIIYRTLAYLILVALDTLPADDVADLVLDSLFRGKAETFPNEVQELLLLPIVDQLLSEMRDVCGADCERIVTVDRIALTAEKDEIETYWLRLEPEGLEEPTSKSILRLERRDAPCKVGFNVDENNDCPLFSFEPTISNVQEFMALTQRVAAFRKSQAAERRKTIE